MPVLFGIVIIYVQPLIPCKGGGRQPMIIEAKKTGIIACFAMKGSENFGLNPNGGGYQ